jgi:predicted DNA-binding transcriptional regulator YafY
MDLGYDQKLKGAMRKLSAALPVTLRGDERRVRQRIYVDNDSWEQRGNALPHLLTVQRAVWANSVLEITYRSLMGSRVGPLAAQVMPLGLVAKAGVWYLVGEREDHIMVLPVERLMQVRMREERFEREADFDLVAFWQGWCAENEHGRLYFCATVRVDAALLPVLVELLADAIEGEGEQIGESGSDGRVSLQLWFASFEEARGRILSYGRALEVVEPPELRLSVVDYARQIAEVYAQH